MTKGLGSGILTGGVVGALVMSVLSLYAPLPQDRIDAAPKLEATQSEAEPAAVVEDTAAPVTAQTSEGTAVEAEVDAETVTPTAPEKVDAAPTDDSAQAVDAPVISGETASAPAAEVANTEAEIAPVVTTQTAENAAPSELAEGSDPVSEQIEAADTDTVVVSETTPAATTAPTEDAAPSLSAQSEEIATRVQPSGLTSPTLVGEEQVQTDEPTQVAAAVPTPEPPKLPSIGSPEPVAEPASADTPIVLPIPNAAAGVVTNRLPSVSSAAPAEDVAVAKTPAPTEADAEALGALAQFATPVEGIEGKSLMAFVLIDSGEDGLPRADLMSLAVPITIALDPVAPNAAAIMAEYRAAGIEVVTLANDLPTAAGPGDVAVAVSAYFDVLSQSVAIMDPLDGRIQSNRTLLQPVLGAIRDSGHGLITYDRGLNTAQQAARRENIPAATVFRVLDADLEQAPKIKRYLDRAAFSANQDGAVVVAGRSYPETVKALVEWSLEKKDASIAVVPVSAIMLAGTGS